MKRNFKVCFLILLGSLFLQLNTVSAADFHLALSPATVEIGTFYNGVDLIVTGQVPIASEIVIRVSGEGESLHLKKKGKVGGLLWMNTGDIIFHNAPKVYKLVTASALKDLDNSPAREFSFAALKNRIEMLPEGSDNDFLLKEFIRLKTKANLYSITPDGISYSPGEGDIKSFQATLHIPPSMKQGEYSVEVAAVQNDSVTGTSSLPLVLKQVGFPEKITSMAFGHSLWYGIISVIIAVLAGLFMSLLFKDNGGSH